MSMISKEKKNEIVNQIQSAFADGPPNGWLAEWACNRFELRLKSALPEYNVSNRTSFDYDFCNTYEIEKVNRSDGYMWTLCCSFVADVYMLMCTQYRQPERRRGRVVSERTVPIEFNPAFPIREVMAEVGFCEVPDQLLDELVGGVELELAEPGEVTIGKCLFRDYG